MFSDILKFNYHLYFNSRTNNRWYPLVAFYYLTYSCGLKCFYCSDGKGRPYYTLKSDEPDTDTLIRILSSIKKYSDNICLTGGEPLDSKNFNIALSTLNTLKFKKIILTTNGIKFEEYADIISRYVDNLIFSLDSMNKTSLSNWYGCDEVTAEKIIQSIKSAAMKKKRKYSLCISAVITEKNIGDLFDVYEFAQSQNIEFAACPQLVGVKENEKLFNNSQYIDLINFFISEKKRGAKIFGNEIYLEYMRDLKKFECRPFTMLVISPEGNIYYPCLEIGHNAGNIHECSSLHSIKKKARVTYGIQPDCPNQCHSACALNFALLLKKPHLAIKEFVNNILGK